MTVRIISPDGTITVDADLVTAVAVEDPRNRLTSNWAVTIRTDDIRFTVFEDARRPIAEHFASYLRTMLKSSATLRRGTLDTALVVAEFDRARTPLMAVSAK